MRLGIVGGGQLGLMLAESAHGLGIACTLLDPAPDAPARRAGHLLVGDYDDPVLLDMLADVCDVCTYEFENVPVQSARRLARQVPTYPPPPALEVAQDRLAEKTMFTDLGIDTARYRTVDSEEDLSDAAADLGYPLVLKTRRGGYDGKGQESIRDAAGLPAAWEALGAHPLLAEEHVAFDRELSILAVRGVDDSAFYPLVENTHADGILRLSVAPAPDATLGLTTTAIDAATRILDELGYRGVLAVELFQIGDRLLANEMAPRVHNSGHWTIEGAATSQFENHVRAVVGLELGPTDVPGAAAMVNCLGAVPEADVVATVPGARLHDYGKAPRPLRKVGHVTVTAPDAARLEPLVRRLCGAAPTPRDA
ncbi:MAG: 5-(carboxyamino)imidazole ribonucleotide synthase [Acidimicrobiia bacterium]